ncbi:MAG: hypothetical protein WC509_04230 [Candidatus Izemoplasmatales bacterium]
MIEFLIGLSISSIWIVLAGLGLLFALRIVAAIRAKADLPAFLAIVLLPFSVGYFRAVSERTRFSTLYRALAATTFFFSLLALFWVFYTHFA